MKKIILAIGLWSLVGVIAYDPLDLVKIQPDFIGIFMVITAIILAGLSGMFLVAGMADETRF